MRPALGYGTYDGQPSFVYTSHYLSLGPALNICGILDTPPPALGLIFHPGVAATLIALWHGVLVLLAGSLGAFH